MIRGAVFTLILLGVSKGLESLNVLAVDEAWLIGATVAVLISYWIPHPSRRKYKEWSITNIALVVGAYVVAFKVPWLLVPLVSYKLAAVFCLSAYLACCIVLMKWNATRKSMTHK